MWFYLHKLWMIYNHRRYEVANRKALAQYRLVSVVLPKWKAHSFIHNCSNIIKLIVLLLILQSGSSVFDLFPVLGCKDDEFEAIKKYLECLVVHKIFVSLTSPTVFGPNWFPCCCFLLRSSFPLDVFNSKLFSRF